jgi:hypothetical protein
VPRAAAAGASAQAHGISMGAAGRLGSWEFGAQQRRLLVSVLLTAARTGGASRSCGVSAGSRRKPLPRPATRPPRRRARDRHRRDPRLLKGAGAPSCTQPKAA